jgi:hypothetical protein
MGRSASVRQQRSLAYRSVAALGCGSLLFLAGQLLFGLLMDTQVQQLRDPEFGFKLRRLRSFLRRHPGRPLILAIGSSHTEMGLRPDAMPRCRLPDGREPVLFNAAMNGHGRITGPLHELLVLDRLLRDGVRPDWVVAEIMPSALVFGDLRAEEVQAGRLSWRDLQYLRTYCADGAQLYGAWCSERALPCYSHRFTVLSLLAPSLLPPGNGLESTWQGVDHSGWRPFPHADLEPSVRKIFLERARAEHAGALGSLHVSPASDRFVHELIAVCRQRGTPLTLFLAPEGDVFRSWYTAAGWAKLNDYLQNLRQETGIVITDARTWRPESDFFDSHHLAVAGATAFSERFGREVIVPFVRGELSPNFSSQANLQSVHLQ